MADSAGQTAAQHDPAQATETDYAALLDAAHQQLDGPIVLIWDNVNVHGIDQLVTVVNNRLKRIQYRPELIDAVVAHTRLELDPAPPSCQR